MEGLMRVAAAVPKLRLGNVKENAAAIVEMLHQAAAEQASLAVFPELCLTGYTCGDLFFQSRFSRPRKPRWTRYANNARRD